MAFDERTAIRAAWAVDTSLGSTLNGVDLANKRILWFDNDNEEYCVSEYTIVNGVVEFKPMPTNTFDVF